MQTSPARFLGSTALVLLVVLCIVAGVNYRYDPANIFSDRTYEAGVADLLAQGKDVANLSDYDERLVQKFFAEKINTAPEILVLGSSRTMNLESKYFETNRFYNASVSGASIEDLYAIIQIYREHSLLPNRLILGIDPWMFNRNSEQSRWKSLEAEYVRSRSEQGREFEGKESFDKQNLLRLQQLINFDYFRASLKEATANRDRAYYATDAVELEVNIRRADGSITYKHDFANRSPEEVSTWVYKQARQTPVYSLGGYAELDKGYSSDLDLLLDRLRIEGIHVTLFLAPYHPIMYDVLTVDGSPYINVLLAEQLVRKVAKQRGLFLLGTFDPVAAGCEGDDFYDEMHPKPICLEKIMRSQNQHNN